MALKSLYGELRTHPYVSVKDLSVEKLSPKNYYKHIKDIIYTSAFPSSTGKHSKAPILSQKGILGKSGEPKGVTHLGQGGFSSLKGAKSWAGRRSEGTGTLKIPKHTHINRDIFTNPNYKSFKGHPN